MNAARFHNALRIMLNLDRHHLVDAGILAADDDSAWKAFRDYPHEASLHLNDANFDRLFALIESKQPKRDVPDTLTALKALADAPVGSSLADRARRRNALDGARAAITKAEDRS